MKARIRTRRCWSALALATLVVAAGPVAAATPAFADGWDAPPDAVPLETNQDETAAQANRDTNDALDDAMRFLNQSGTCRGFIGDSPQGEDAATVLKNVRQAVPPRIKDNYNQEDRDEQGRPVFARAPVGQGSAGTIYIFKAFHTDAAAVDPSYYNVADSSTDTMYFINRYQIQVMVILHELMHLTGKLDGGHNRNEAGINEAIIKNCIPGAQRVPWSTSDTGGGGAPEADRGGYVPQPGIFENPGDLAGGGGLPDGEGNPELVFCCDEVPEDDGSGGGGGPTGGGGGGRDDDCDPQWEAYCPTTPNTA